MDSYLTLQTDDGHALVSTSVSHPLRMNSSRSNSVLRARSWPRVTNTYRAGELDDLVRIEVKTLACTNGKGRSHLEFVQ